MSDHARPPHNTFVIRLWWEWQTEDAHQGMTWRGRIDHVQSGEGLTFRDTRQLLAFIERFITPSSPPPGHEGS